MEVWLVRHAEDRSAAQGRFGDEGLSARGVEQARALARAIRSVRFCVCLASPLERATETARVLCEGRGLEPEIDPHLAEGAIGDLAGMTIEEAKRLHPRDFAIGSTVIARLRATGRTAPGGESRADFITRARTARDRVVGLLADARADVHDRALVVAHGGLLDFLLQLLVDMEPRDEVPFGFDHCGVARILSYREPPAFGPAPMIRFGLPAPMALGSKP